MRIVILLSLLGLLGIGCGTDEDEKKTPAGGACSSSSDCSGGICAVSQDFPSGYCTQGCEVTNAASCPDGSVCIDDVSGVPANAGVSAICYESCETDLDCDREGFACLEKADHLVCRNGT